MKNLNFNSLTKSCKSILLQLAKGLKIRPNVLYAILGLVAVILLALALGGKREGFSSMREIKKAQARAINDMLDAIDATSWTKSTDKTAFMDNVNTYFKKKMELLNQGDVKINTFDLGGPAGATVPDRQVYASNNFPQPMYDASNKALPLYVDNIPGHKADLRKYTLTKTIANPVKQADLDALMIKIDTQISRLNRSDQIALKKAFKALMKNLDDMVDFINSKTSEDDVEEEEERSTTYDASTYDSILSERRGGRYHGDRYDASGLYVSRYDRDRYHGDRYRDEHYDASGNYVSRYDRDRYAFSDGYDGGYDDYEGSYDDSDFNEGPPGPRGPMGLTGPMGPMGLRGPRGPAGIISSNIPPGSQDLYMLKTEAVPPSNPPGAGASSTRSSRSDKDSKDSRAGASSSKGSSKDSSKDSSRASSLAGAISSSTSPNAYNDNPSPCQTCSGKPAPVQPCPPCERCPEPAFDCTRVPNYNSASINQYLPQPVLADFSQFGM
jgi:hypothetical protein